MSSIPLALIAVFLLAAALASWASVGLLGMTRMNPITVYMSIWSTVLILYETPWLDLRPLTLTVFEYVSIAGIAFLAGSMVVWTVMRSRRSRRPGAATPWPLYDDRRLVRFHLTAVAALTGYTVLQVALVLPDIKAAGGLQAILGGSGVDVRRAFLSAAIASSQTSLGGGSLVVGVLGYALFLGTISVFWSGYLARRGRYVLAALPLLVLAIQSLILLQRADFVYPFLLFGFSWIYHRGVATSQPNSGRKRPKIVIAAMAGVVAIVLIVPLVIRQPDLDEGQVAASLETYFVGGVAGLNALSVDDPSLTSAASPFTGIEAPTSATYPTPTRPLPRPTSGGGVWSFFGAASVLSRLGLPIGTPSNFFAFVTIQAHNAGIINVYTYLIFAYYDYGFLGILLIPFLLGAAATAFDKAVRVYHRWALIPAASILMTTVVMTFFSLTLTRDLRYDVLLVVAPLIGRQVLRHPTKSVGRPAQLRTESALRHSLVRSRRP